MLACIAVAGSLYFHAEHNDEAGVRVITNWEFAIPVEGTVVRRTTDPSEDYYIGVTFTTVASGNYTLHLDYDNFNRNWSPVDLLESCGGNGR